MTIERGASPSSGTDLDDPVDLADLVGLERLGGGRVDDLPRLHVELAPVTLTLDRGAVDLAAVGEVAVSVRADVAERVELALDPSDGDLGAAHVARLRLSLRHLVGIPDRHVLRHRVCLLRPRASVLGGPAYGTCGEAPRGSRPPRKKRTAHALARAR